MKALYGAENPSSGSDVIEGRLVEIGLRALELGVSVVIDFGLWGRDERSALRQAATDRGARVELRYLAVPRDEMRRRLDQRWLDQPHTTWEISDEELDGWAAVMQVPDDPERSTGASRSTIRPLGTTPGTSGARVVGRRPWRDDGLDPWQRGLA